MQRAALLPAESYETLQLSNGGDFRLQNGNIYLSNDELHDRVVQITAAPPEGAERDVASQTTIPNPAITSDWRIGDSSQ